MNKPKTPKLRINRGKIERWLALLFLGGLAILLIYQQADGNVLWYVVGAAAIYLAFEKITARFN